MASTILTLLNTPKMALCSVFGIGFTHVFQPRHITFDNLPFMLFVASVTGCFTSLGGVGGLLIIPKGYEFVISLLGIAASMYNLYRD